MDNIERNFLTWHGNRAHSNFQLQGLLSDLKPYCSKLISIESYWIYWLSLNKKLLSVEQNYLEQLLDIQINVDNDLDSKKIWVAPRLGTVSPWASNAMEIIKQCGFGFVEKLERGKKYVLYSQQQLLASDLTAIKSLLFDELVESLLVEDIAIENIFTRKDAKPLTFIPSKTIDLQNTNKVLSLGLSTEDIQYLVETFPKRELSDAELMMYSQINSEHCRHKLFRRKWRDRKQLKLPSCWEHIVSTMAANPPHILSAYHDNAAVAHVKDVQRLAVFADDNCYKYKSQSLAMVMKVETHNHPTAIEPFAGAATGLGGEIRDESATGRGAETKMGWAGYTVSNLKIPSLIQPWEENNNIFPIERLASPLEIMQQGPLGSASFSNEFGRPIVCGYFRTFEWQDSQRHWGFHKPIMIAGGLGQIEVEQINKNDLPINSLIIVLGGPGYKIGLGGGSASSQHSGVNEVEIDFASVQRHHPEMQRRAQQVIHKCSVLDNNPILSIHDVGAGGLANALPELVAAAGRGALLDIANIPIGDNSLSPLEIWCNESQERFVLAVAENNLDNFINLAKRENCPFAVLGRVIAEKQFILQDSRDDSIGKVIDLPLKSLFNNAKLADLQYQDFISKGQPFDWQKVDIIEAMQACLQFPAVADKSFLLTIHDRSVGGLIARDPMVGHWQIPVADCGVSCRGFKENYGEAIAVGERSPVALLDPIASIRLAAGEAITNLLAADIEDISTIVFSANWMVDSVDNEQTSALYAAVQDLSRNFCKELDITIPVGKDSTSMRATWYNNDGKKYTVSSPMTGVITAYAPVEDVRLTLTPEMQSLDFVEETSLVLVDLADGKQRLGGSVLSQIYNTLGVEAANLTNTKNLAAAVKLLKVFRHAGLLLAYHDKSDGGLFVTLVEMAIASRIGLEIDLNGLGSELIPSLFNEELGFVVQLRSRDVVRFIATAKEMGLLAHKIAKCKEELVLDFKCKGNSITQTLLSLYKLWALPGYHIQSLRDNPRTARAEYDNLLDFEDPGLQAKVAFIIKAPSLMLTSPKVAILREQGTNGHLEMAAAFTKAGFTSIDVTMQDLQMGRMVLADYQAMAVCGGFSYGDVFGAGRGWANKILLNKNLLVQFEEFFNDPNTLTLGVCNGCQMLAALKSLIPGASSWPTFENNLSDKFESRLLMVKIQQSPAILLEGMTDSILPIIVAHKEGRVKFTDEAEQDRTLKESLVSMHFVNSLGQRTTMYPANPNGSQQGITGLTSTDGRALIMMPHPERCFRTVQYSWHPPEWKEDGPWLQIFYNAYRAFSGKI